MAGIAETHARIADCFGVSPSNVKLLGLQLLDHGLRAKSPRGLASAQLTPREVANYGIALICREGPREAPRTVKAIGDLELASVEAWQNDPDQDFMLGGPSMRLNKDRVFAATHTMLETIALHDFLEHVPVQASFGDTLGEILEKLSKDECAQVQHLEIAIAPLTSIATMKAVVTNRFFIVTFGSVSMWPTMTGLYAVYGIHKSKLLELASTLASPPDKKPKITVPL